MSEKKLGDLTLNELGSSISKKVVNTTKKAWGEIKKCFDAPVKKGEKLDETNEKVE